MGRQFGLQGGKKVWKEAFYREGQREVGSYLRHVIVLTLAKMVRDVILVEARERVELFLESLVEDAVIVRGELVFTFTKGLGDDLLDVVDREELVGLGTLGVAPCRRLDVLFDDLCAGLLGSSGLEEELLGRLLHGTAEALGGGGCDGKRVGLSEGCGRR